MQMSRSKSQERESATLFFFPGNHCEYSLMLWWVKWLACFLAISRRMVSLIGSDPLSKKIVFFSQPVEVVLSVIDRGLSLGGF